MESDLSKLFLDLLSAARGGQYLLVASIVIIVLTRLVGWLGQRWRPGVFRSSVLPWISAVLATGGMVLAAILAGRSIGEAVIVGVIGGATASGLWSLVIKYLPLVGKTGA